MQRNKVVQKHRGKIRHSEYQTLGQRIKWLRAKQQPVMTQQQLADLSGVNSGTISDIEEDVFGNYEFNTIRRIAHALGCRIFINIMMTPSRAQGACQMVCPELPPLPKRKGKASVAARVLAVRALHYPWRTEYQRLRKKRRKATSGKANSNQSALQKAGTHSTPHEQP